MIVDIPYEPHSPFTEIHNDSHRFKVIAAGRRSGKTHFSANEEIKEVMTHPGEYWYIAPTYKQAKLIAWDVYKHYSVREILKKKPNESELMLAYKGGGKIRLIGSDKPENLRGPGLKGVVFDEFAAMNRYVWQAIVRPMLTESKGWAIFLGTPQGKQNILYEQFIKDGAYHDKEYRTEDNQAIPIDSDYKSWQFPSTVSPYIDKVEIDKARMELAPQYFRQEYEASFEAYTGIIYKEYVARHNIEIEPKQWWKHYIGIDTGKYTAISFVGVDDMKRAYVYDEIYDVDGVVGDIARQIKYRVAKYGIRPTFVIDSASQVKREYELNGISTEDSYKEVLNAIAIVRNRFAQDALFIDKNRCPMHMVEHKGYIWDDKSKKVQPKKENDHTCNSVQYVINKLTGFTSKRPGIEQFKKTLAYANIHKKKKVLRFS